MFKLIHGLFVRQQVSDEKVEIEEEEVEEEKEKEIDDVKIDIKEEEVEKEEKEEKEDVIKEKTFQIITIEGNIGSGKSTLLARLKEEFKNDTNVVFVREPVDEWEKIMDSTGKSMLHKFYEDQEKYSFAFQMMAYISRLSLLREAITANPSATIITERGLHTDRFVFAKMLYDMGKMEDVCYAIYLRWFDEFSKDYPITKVIYVETDPEICHERITKRSRTGEDSIPLEYLQKCHEYHNKMMYSDKFLFSRQHDTFINGNDDIYKNPHILDQWIQDMKAYIGK